MSATLISQPDNFAPALGGELIYQFESYTSSDIQVLMIDARSNNVFSVKTIFGHSLPCGINAAVPALSLFNPHPLTEITPKFRENKCLTSKVTAKFYSIDDWLLKDSPSRVFTLARRTIEPGVLLTTLPASNREVSTSDSDELSLAVESGDTLSSIITVSEKERTLVLDSSALTASAGIYTIPISVAAIIELAAAGGLDANSIKGIEIEVRVNDCLAGTVSYSISATGGNNVRLAWINSLGAIEYHTFGQTLKMAAIKTSPNSVGVQSLPVIGKSKTELKLSAGVCPQCENQALSEILASPKVWRIFEGQTKEVEVMDDSAALHSDSPAPFTITIRE